jgi:HK97 gp10 family phage protein
MARDTGITSGGFTIRGGAELVAALRKIDRKTTGGLARGAVGEGANTIRDLAKITAGRIGLLDQGPYTTPSGNKIVHRGQIPLSIFANVEKGSKRKAVARVKIDSRISEKGRTAAQKSAGSHWTMVELGSIHNPPRPFLRPSIIEGAQLAVDAIIDVIERGIARYNVPGGGN